MQEFSPQLPQHHPFSLGHEASSHRSSHSSPQSQASGSTSNSSHPTGHSFMHDPIVYGGLNRQSLGYNVHVSADKNLLLAPGLGGMPQHALGHPQVSHYTCLDLDREEKEKYTFESKFDVDVVKRKEAHQEVHVNDLRPKVGIKISSGSYYTFAILYNVHAHDAPQKFSPQNP